MKNGFFSAWNCCEKQNDVLNNENRGNVEFSLKFREKKAE